MAPTDSTIDAAAISNADDGAFRAVNASPQSGSRRREPTSWADLFPADLLGSFATFLDPESVGHFTITAGPQISPIVKKAYLKRNLRYLSGNLENRTIFRAFLDANEDWRGWYDEGAEGGLLSASDRDIFNSIFNEITVVLRIGQVEVVKHLIEVRGHDVNETEEDSSLLERAIVLGNFPMVEYFLSVPGIDVNVKSSNGTGLLHIVLSPDISSDCVELLLLHRDIDVNIRNGRGNTPLHLAAASGAVEDKLLLLLRNENIDLNAVTETGGGLTPLCIATMIWAKFGDVQHERAVKHLIEAGADPHAQDTDGCTPLAYIEARGDEEQAALMKDWIRKNRGVKRKAATG